MKYIIKLGGSVLTAEKSIVDYPKNAEDALNMADSKIKSAVISQLAKQITSNMSLFQTPCHELVLITGAGCYGHPQVKANLPAADIHHVVKYLNHYVKTALSQNFLENKSYSPYDYVKCLDSNLESGEKRFDIAPLWDAMKENISKGIALTHGDVVPMIYGKTGRLGGHEVISGDDIAPYIAKTWPADGVIMVMDVNGVHTTDPKHNSGAKRLDQIVADEKIRDDSHFRELMVSKYSVIFKDNGDVTKGLFGKVRKLYDLAYETGISSRIVGASHLENALSGMFVGTLIFKPGTKRAYEDNDYLRGF